MDCLPTVRVESQQEEKTVEEFLARHEYNESLEKSKTIENPHNSPNAHANDSFGMRNSISGRGTVSGTNPGAHNAKNHRISSNNRQN